MIQKIRKQKILILSFFLFQVPGLNGKCTRKVQSSEVVVEWEIPSNQQEGLYRIVHNGVAKLEEDKLLKYKGVSREFYVG